MDNKTKKEQEDAQVSSSNASSDENLSTENPNPETTDSAEQQSEAVEQDKSLDDLKYTAKMDGKDVPDYLAEIKEATSGVTKQWLRLASILLAAKKDLSKESFKVVKENCDLNKSTFHKLIKVASSERLNRNAEAFEQVRNWVTLYEITLLTDSQFGEMMATYFGEGKPNHVKLKDLEALRSGKVLKKHVGSPLIQLRVETKGLDSCVKLQDFELEAVEILHDLGKRYDLSMFVESYDLPEKVDKRIGREIVREFAKEKKELAKKKHKKLRRFYDDELDTFEKPNLTNGNISKDKQFIKKWGVGKEEIFEPERYDEMLEMFGMDPVLRPGEKVPIDANTRIQY